MTIASRFLGEDVRRALAYVKPYRWRLALVLALSLLSTVLSLFLPLLSRALVDRALIGHDADVLVRIVAAFFGLTLASFALNAISGLRYTRVSVEILFDMRLALFRHLQRLSPRFYARTPLGQIAARINGDIGEIQRVVAEMALAWVGNVVFLVGTVVILVRLDPILFGVSLVLLPLSLWALVRYRERLERAIADLRNRSAGIGSFLIETLLGMKLVVSLNAQQREADRFREQNDAFIGSLMAMQRLTYLAGGVPGLLLSLGSAAVFLIGGFRVINGAITLGTLVAFVAYQMRLVGPIQGMMGLYTNLATARVSLRRVHEILDAPVEVLESADAVALDVVRGKVEFDDVTFAFDRGVPVLDQVKLTVHAGECVAIVGRSGEGKSTIADLLVRHLDPDAGRVRLDGHDLKTLRLADLRRHVVVVDQDPFVFHATMAENIRYARPGANDAAVLDAARASGLGDLVARLPEGMHTPVGERGRALSAGERQRLAIARAFLADPAVLVLDEATGALDPATEAQVVSGYEAVMRGRTTIVITHRLELARRAGRIVVLDQGRIVEQGGADSLLVPGSAFAALFATHDAAR
jgi:ATP-binding cassette subfamily B protein